MNWRPEYRKPEPYEPVLLALIGGDYTTGHWTGGRGRAGEWIGYSFNQSPPAYVLGDGVVVYWAEIIPPGNKN